MAAIGNISQAPASGCGSVVCSFIKRRVVHFCLSKIQKYRTELLQVAAILAVIAVVSAVFMGHWALACLIGGAALCSLLTSWIFIWQERTASQKLQVENVRLLNSKEEAERQTVVALELKEKAEANNRDGASQLQQKIDEILRLQEALAVHVSVFEENKVLKNELETVNERTKQLQVGVAVLCREKLG